MRGERLHGVWLGTKPASWTLSLPCIGPFLLAVPGNNLLMEVGSCTSTRNTK
ncbi:hypothetical protein GGI35DRAFT_449500 [Trichoderma velutinum]